jgi:hypothetical protein
MTGMQAYAAALAGERGLPGYSDATFAAASAYGRDAAAAFRDGDTRLGLHNLAAAMEPATAVAFAAGTGTLDAWTDMAWRLRGKDPRTSAAILDSARRAFDIVAGKAACEWRSQVRHGDQEALARIVTPLGPEGPSFLKLGHQNLEPVDQQASNVDTPA